MNKNRKAVPHHPLLFVHAKGGGGAGFTGDVERDPAPFANGAGRADLPANASATDVVKESTKSFLHNVLFYDIISIRRWQAGERAVTRRGFTLLYAVLVASLTLSIGIAIANIALKESLLSSTARESQLAFYAANAGIECGLYWNKRKAFAGFEEVPPPGPNPIYCNNQSIPVSTTGADPNLCDPCELEFHFAPASPCINSPEVEVEVRKEILAGNAIKTTIIARGYNTCDVSNPRRVERGFGVKL